MSVNKAIILGRLGADPEGKHTSSGKFVANFNLATTDSWVDRDGNKQEKTEWHRVVVWGKLAEVCLKHLRKGRQAYVEGSLQTRSWEDSHGQKKFTTEILATKIQFMDNNSNTSEKLERSPSKADDFHPEPAFDSDEEIPF